MPPPKKTPAPPTEKQMEDEERNHDCMHRNKYTAAQRLNFYPFNKAKNIQVVSFRGVVKQNPDRIVPTLPRNNDTICYSQLSEIVTLRTNQVDSLTDILYNTGYKGPVHTITETMCFNPHNAILFLDKKGKAFAYIEICFLCSRYEPSSKNIDLGEICNQKYTLLKNYFISIGIKTGTINNDENAEPE